MVTKIGMNNLILTAMKDGYIKSIFVPFWFYNKSRINSHFFFIEHNTISLKKQKATTDG